MLAKFKAWVQKFEATPFGTQVFRFLRLSVVGIGAALAAGTPVGWAALVGVIVGAVEAAFRQVFPAAAVIIPIIDPPKVNKTP